MHHVGIEDAMSDLGASGPQDMRPTFGDVDVERIRKEKPIRLEIVWRSADFFCVYSQFAYFRNADKRDKRKCLSLIDESKKKVQKQKDKG